MSKDFDYTVHEIYGVVDESDSSNWGLVFSKITWGNNSPTYDLRRFDVTTIDEDIKKFSKGVSFFHDEGVNRLTNLLLDMGFGDMPVLQESVDRRSSLYTRLDGKNMDVITLYMQIVEG